MMMEQHSASSDIQIGFIINEDTYNCQQFIQEIRNLQDISVVYTCPFNQTELALIYEQTLEKFGLKTMDLNTIREFIANLKETNKSEIREEVVYFKNSVKNKLIENTQTLSRRQLWKIIAGCKGVDKGGIVSEMLTEKSRSTDYVSCNKLMALLDEIITELEQSVNPNLNSEELMRKKIGESKIQVHGNMSQIIDVFRNQQKMQLQKYFLLWHRKMEYVYEFINDDQVRFQVQSFLEDVRQAQNDILDEVKVLQGDNEELRSTCWQYEDVNQKLNDQIELYEQMVNDRKSQMSETQLQLKQFERENRRINDENDLLNAAVNQGRVQLIQLSSQYTQIEEELTDYKERYNQIYTHYSRIAKQQEDQNIIAKKQEQTKIFTERTVKQQLDDALHKFNRLLKERDAERNKFAEKEENNMGRIDCLEAKIAEMQEQMRAKNQKLNDYIRTSKIHSFRNSVINNKSRISMRSGIVGIHGSGIFQLPQSLLVTSSFKKNNSQNEASQSQTLEKGDEQGQRKAIRVSAIVAERTSKNALSHSKMKKIDIMADKKLSLIEQEQDVSQMVDNTLLPPEQNLTNIIQADNFPGGLNKKGSGKKQMKEDISQVVVGKKKQEQKNQYFMSKGVHINVYGVKNETTFVLTRRRVCFFDTKMRLSRFIPLENIKAFVFCRHNPTLFLIRPKNVHQLNSREHFTNPIILSTRNRGAFAHYLTQRISKLIKDNEIQLLTRFEDDIFLKSDGQQINMKHKIANMKNPYRLALSHVQVFYVKLQEEGLLNFKYNAILIVQPIGLVCFQGTETNQIEAARQFLYLLPIQDCKIAQKQDSKEAPNRKVKISYQTDSLETYFSMIFNTKEDLKLFLRVCEEQKRGNQSFRTNIYKSLDKTFSTI